MSGLRSERWFGGRDISGFIHRASIHAEDDALGPGDVMLVSAVAQEAIALAEEKVAGENLVRQKLEEGMPVAEAFRTYGVI